jgi:hypothetical protein
MTGEQKYGRATFRLLQEAMDEAAQVCGDTLLRACPCGDHDCLAGRYKRLKQRIVSYNRREKN